MADDVKVSMGGVAVGSAAGSLSIIGLGSCVGVALYCPLQKIGGLAHIVLPDSSRARPGTGMEKFANVGIPALLDRMGQQGASILFTHARLVGGASMFKATAGEGMFNIGESNVAACRDMLRKFRVKVIGEDVLGTRGRTMRFDLDTGKINVRYVDGTTIEL